MKKIFTLAAIAAFAVAANAQNETVLLNETAMEAQTVVTSPNGTFKYAASEATTAKSDNGYEISFNDCDGCFRNVAVDLRRDYA